MQMESKMPKPQDDVQDLPPGYRMTELGPLPEEWRVVRLGEITSISRKPRQRIWPDTLPFIPMEAIPDDGSLYPSRIEYRSIRDIRSGVYCEGGDILFAKITPSLENGKQAIVPPEIGLAYATTEVYPLRAKHNEVDSFYLFALLRAPWIRAYLAEKMEGSTGRQRLAKQVLLNFLVPLPPLPEQRAIAHVLRTVQEAKEATERVIAALRDLKKSLMRHLFTYGPVPVDAADQVSLQQTEIGPIPAHWRVVKLGEIMKLRKGTVHPSDVPNARYVGLEHLIPGEIRIKQFDRASMTRSAKAVFEKGDILYGKLRPYLDKAAVAEWSGICSTDILVLRPSEERMAIFFAYLMHTPFVLNHAVATTTGVNHPRTSWKALSQALIPFPPVDEQREIARILQTVDRKIEAEEARKEALDTLFKTLLHHLMTAKIRLPKAFVAQFDTEVAK